MDKNVSEKKKKQCELLVPAGSPEAFVAAVENGADAVYVGGRFFNARTRAENFTDAQMAEAVDYAHIRGVKVYGTLNTLVRNDELQKALEYAAFLYETGVDALIVQDLGLGYLIRKYLRDFPMHLSTQATVYDLEGVKAAAELGYERVVLAREVGKNELRRIMAESPVEIEIFVHGALCICYSGQCQMSRYIGGRSGNRGACAQPCRLAYTVEPSENADGNSKNGRNQSPLHYPLSPKDLCLLDHLQELTDLGIASLKIEGRMKSPEYVAVVTSVYRKYLDACLRGDPLRITEEDRGALLQIFNRSGFTEGYPEGDPGSSLLSGDYPKNLGVPVGKVIQKEKKGSTLVRVHLNKPLRMGDGFEIHGKKILSSIVTYRKDLGKGQYLIGDVKNPAMPGSPIYRTSSMEQLKKARESFSGITFTSGKFRRKVPVVMTLAGSGGILSLVCHTPDGTSGKAVSGKMKEERENPAARERYVSCLEKCGGTPFAIKEIRFKGDFYFRPKTRELNALRREALQDLERKRIFRREKMRIPLLDLEKYHEPRTGKKLEYVFYTWEACRRYTQSHSESIDTSGFALIPASELVSVEKDELQKITRDFAGIIPYIPNVTAGKESRILQREFKRILAFAKPWGIYVGNISWIRCFTAEGVKVLSDSGLNIFNFAAEHAYSILGAEPGVWSEEFFAKKEGRYPLMILEHKVSGRIMKTGRAGVFRILRRNTSDQTVILPESARSARSGSLPESFGIRTDPEGRVRRIYIEGSAGGATAE